MNSVKSQLLQKPEGIKFERQKKTQLNAFILGFKDQIINAVPEKKLKLVRRKGLFLGDAGSQKG